MNSPAAQIPDTLLGAPVIHRQVTWGVAQPDLVRGQPETEQVWANRREAVVRIPEVATFAVRDGARVFYEPAPGAHPGDIAAYLHATVTALLLAQQGRFALHATSVRINDLDVAIAGVRGVGKSTSALALAARGHQVLCDDVLPLEPQRHQTLHIPTSRPIRVTPETAQALEVDLSGAHEPGRLAGKFALPCQPVAPSRLDVIVILRRHTAVATSCRVDRRAALRLVNTFAYRAGLLAPWRGEIFRWAAGVAATVPVLSLYRPTDGWSVDGVADLIEDVVASRPGLSSA